MGSGLILLFIIVVLAAIVVATVRVLEWFPFVGLGVVLFCLIMMCILIGVAMKRDREC